MSLKTELTEYVDEIEDGILSVNLEQVITKVLFELNYCRDSNRKIIFIGNGGSAALASHMTTDFTNTGGIRAMCFSDSALLTCYANDYGFENVFAKAIENYAIRGDVLIAISSSGCSPDVLAGVAIAKKIGCFVITLSGFDPNNPLVSAGDANIYVPIVRPRYAAVEASHDIILSFICECLRKQKPR